MERCHLDKDPGSPLDHEDYRDQWHFVEMSVVDTGAHTEHFDANVKENAPMINQNKNKDDGL